MCVFKKVPDTQKRDQVFDIQKIVHLNEKEEVYHPTALNKGRLNSLTLLSECFPFVWFFICTFCTFPGFEHSI